MKKLQVVQVAGIDELDSMHKTENKTKQHKDTKQNYMQDLLEEIKHKHKTQIQIDNELNRILCWIYLNKTQIKFDDGYLQVVGIDELDSMLAQFVAQRLGKVLRSYQTTWVTTYLTTLGYLTTNKQTKTYYVK